MDLHPGCFHASACLRVSIEGDCDPWEEGTEIDRRYMGRHEYRRAGRYRIRITLSKAGKKILSESMSVDIRAGLGDPTRDY